VIEMDASTSAGTDWQAQMATEMTTAGMAAPAVIIADGKLHRFNPDGGKGDNGWYVVYSNERFTSWAFGDWRHTDSKHKGHTKPSKRLSRKEWRDLKKQLRERHSAVEAERLAEHEKAAGLARARWASLQPASAQHPYLKRKKVEPCGMRQDGVNLVFAMTGIDDGKIWSWREISPDGFKSNQKGARQRGCYFRIGEPNDAYVICEGFATGATLSMIGWYGVPGFYGKASPTILVAGDSGNLVHIAKGVRAKHRDATIILAADDDWLTPGNPGLTAATRAARAVDGILVKPWFNERRSTGYTDFNDQHNAYGLDEVRETIRLAMIEHEETQEAIRGKAGPFGDPPDELLPPIEFPSSNRSVEGSEDWLALALVDRHQDEWRYVPRWGMWMHFRAGRWVQDERHRTLTYARKVCSAAATEAEDKTISRAATVAAVERLARIDERMATAVDEWDRDPWLLNTPDGTIDLRTGKQRPHVRSDYVTKITAVAPKDVSCPVFLAFLHKITDGNEELVRFLQRSLGYAMTGLTKEHALFFWYGTGGNGKSVLLNTITGILSEYHVAAGIETFVESHSDRHPTELASLRGSHIVTAVETEKGRNWAENKIKALTGGDPISARYMRQDFFTYTPKFTLVIAGNHKPSLRSVDQAIRRRLYLVPFTVNIPVSEQDKDLFEKLKAEWPAILHWLIQGCLEWQRIGLAAPKIVMDATEEYLADEDTITAWIDDRCIRDNNAWESTNDLFTSYSGWAQKSGEKTGTKKEFRQALGKTNFMRFQRMNSGNGYYGLKINPMNPADDSR
jgi:putative DNA primase/helicase